MRIDPAMGAVCGGCSALSANKDHSASLGRPACVCLPVAARPTGCGPDPRYAHRLRRSAGGSASADARPTRRALRHRARARPHRRAGGHRRRARRQRRSSGRDHRRASRLCGAIRAQLRAALLPHPVVCREHQGGHERGLLLHGNAAGRLAGTVLSAALYQWRGLEACLWASVAFVAAAALLSLLLPTGQPYARALAQVRPSS
jgi:hypothetical protein